MSLTARHTSRAGTKVGLSDLPMPYGMARNLTDKSYPGDNPLLSGVVLPSSNVRVIKTANIGEPQSLLIEGKLGNHEGSRRKI